MNVLKAYAVLLHFTMLYLSYAEAVDVHNCGSDLEFTDVQIEECLMDDDTACTLHIGGSREISFIVNTGSFDINVSLINDVALDIRGTKFNITTVPTDPCDVLICPFRQNYVGTYSGEIYINGTFPPLRATLRWILRTSDSGDQVMCFDIPVVLLSVF